MTNTEILAQLHTMRERRLYLQRQADTLEQEEKTLVHELTKDMSDGEHAISAGGYTLSAKRRTTAVATDWAAILDFVAATQSLDLLQKRLTESAVKARWDAGVVIPGVRPDFVYKVVVTKDAP